MSEERARDLFLVTDHFLESHQRWVLDEDIRWITEGYKNAVEHLLILWEDGDIPASCRVLSNIVTELGDSWREYVAEARMSGSGDGLETPKGGFFKLVEMLGDAREASKPKRIRRLEPILGIGGLIEQKVSPRQICEIYEWKNPDGSPDFARLDEEIAEPGKHSKGYVPPSWQKDQQAAKAQREVIEGIRSKHQTKIKSLTKPAPEPISVLIQQKCSATQIASMKHVTIEEVLAEAKRLGLPEPPINYEPPRTGPHDPDINESRARQLEALGNQPADLRAQIEQPSATQDGLSVEDQIIQYHLGGHQPKEIADLVSEGGAKVSRAKVAATIKEYEETTAQKT